MQPQDAIYNYVVIVKINMKKNIIVEYMPNAEIGDL